MSSRKSDMFLVRCSDEIGRIIREEAKRLDISCASFIRQSVTKALRLYPNKCSRQKCTCGKYFLDFGGKGPQRLYCSNACKQRAYRKRRDNNERL